MGQSRRTADEDARLKREVAEVKARRDKKEKENNKSEEVGPEE